MKKAVILSILSVLVVMLAFNCQGDMRVHASTIPIVSFSQSTYIVPINKPFNVTVMVTDVTDLVVWQARIVFDPSVMQYITATAPSDNIYGTRLTVFRGAQDASKGAVLVGTGILPLDPTFTGNGTLITITFIMNATSITPLVFDTSNDYSFLLNSQVNEIPFTSSGASVKAVRYMTDVNNDGIVDMKDIMMAVMDFNSFPNTSRWNVYADVDGNGHVDLRDVVLIVADFGLHMSSSGGIPGIEKMEFAGFYAETTSDGWIVHTVINNTGSTPIIIDNSLVFINSRMPSFYQAFAPIENFGNVTLQQGDTTDLQFTLLGGNGSPWQPGSEFYVVIITASGDWYITLDYHPLSLP